MTLPTRHRLVVTREGHEESQLVVACPHRLDPTPISECADCELCEGLDLEGTVSVRCAVAPPLGYSDVPRAASAVSSIMASPVATVPADAAIENVRWMLLERNIGAVPVVDSLGRPIGILAKTDLLRDNDEPSATVIARGRRVRPYGEVRPYEAARSDEAAMGELEVSGLRAADVMTPVVRAVLQHATIAAAASVLAAERIHHLLVVDDSGAMVGIVSSLDIVRWVAASERFAPRTASE